MSPSPFDRFLEATSRVTGHQPRVSGGSAVCCCPHHEADGRPHRPSLSVAEKNGRVLLRCFAGCDTADVLAAVGMEWSDLSPVVRPLRPAAPPERPVWVDPTALAEWRDEAVRRLLRDDSAALARRYLRSRGVDGDLVRHYQLGFATDHAPDQRLAMLRNRLVIVEFPHHAEGRIVPGLEADTVYADVKWLSAKGSSKRWWRAGDVDPARPVLLVEGAFDVLGAHRITDGNAVATLSKTNAKPESARWLARRGVAKAMVSLDHDADAAQWRRVLTVCREAGLSANPVTGPPDGCDWGDLLQLGDEPYYRLASEAMTLPQGGVA